MTPAVLGTAVGAATVTVGRGALAAVGNGLSFLAQLANAASGASPQEAESPAKEFQNSYQERCDHLRQRVQRQLAALGIRLSQPVELVSNGQGGIAVAGSHPQQAAVESALESDILLERDFNQVATEMTSLVITVPSGS